jgi:hypothetical protein
MSEPEADPAVQSESDDLALREAEARPEWQEELRQIESLAEQCRAEGLDIEVEREEFGVYARLDFPSGRDTRSRFVTAKRAEALKGIPLKDVVFLGRFQAICNYEKRTIDAFVVTANGRNNPTTILRRRLGLEQKTSKPIFDAEQGPVRLVLGPPSVEMDAVVGTLNPNARDALSLQIRGVNIERHDDALAVLERLADALFFEIDAELGVPLVLDQGRLSGGVQRWRGDRPPEIRFPSSEYDADPMALYWYARGATNMPLLQFLAFYQVLEFYFPVFVEQEVRRRIKGVVKDPKFSAHDEGAISRIVQATRLVGARGGADERAQLRAVIKGCGDPEQIREVLERPPSRASYFGKRKGGPARQILRAEMSDGDLMDAVSERVYEIRCRIVHTKDSSSGEDRILPFSHEADRLGPDIRLIEMLARTALITSSRELKANS